MHRILQKWRESFPWWVRRYHRLQIRGLSHLPKQGSAIIAANHSGGFDLDNFWIMSLFDHIKVINPARKQATLYRLAQKVRQKVKDQIGIYRTKVSHQNPLGDKNS